MKNLIKIFGIIVFFMALSINLITSKSINNNGKSIKLNNIVALALADGEGGNQATCYSTYKTFLGGTTIWVCGSCVQQKVSSYSDAGICYF